MNTSPPPLHLRFSLALVLLAILLAVYGSGVAAQPVPDDLPHPPSASIQIVATKATPPIPPTQIPTVSPTGHPVRLTATVWNATPQAPVLLYHHFSPDNGLSDPTHVRLSDFRKQLQAFYDSGYSLVSIERWLAGDLRVPAGRRPLILTIDDLFFADQISLDTDGAPLPATGLGLLWRFAQEHPDFGFSVALFYNLGDKDYANVPLGNTFQKGIGWESALARTVVWCIEHDAIPYNHFYHHPQLDFLTSAQIESEARQNDLQLQALLQSVGRADLVERLGNLLALPYGHWPVTEAGKLAVTSYISPNGNPVQGVMEVGEAAGSWYLQPVYSPGFDRNHIPRRVGGVLVTDELTAHRDRVPLAQECQLAQIDASKVEDVAAVMREIAQATNSGLCPQGIYALQGWIIQAQADQVIQLWPKQ